MRLRCSQQKLLLVLLAAFSFALILSFLASNSTVTDRIGEEVDRLAAQGPMDQNSIGASSSADCKMETYCSSSEILIRLGGETAARPPFACLNDLSVFTEKELRRGVLVARLDGESLAVEEGTVFDVSTTDEKLILWLRNAPDNAVIVVASFGDVAERISPDARRALERFGASRLKDWRGGSGYALLGQKSLQKGSAKEVLESLSSGKESRAPFSECVSFPLGPLNASSFPSDEGRIVNRVDEARLAELVPEGSAGKEATLGQKWPNCGMDAECPTDNLPMAFYSGSNKDDSPKMCIGSHMIFAAGLNEAGRGLNIAVVDAKSKRVLRTGHFDTYEQNAESSGLELFLDSVLQGEIVAVVSFDEASTMLTDMAKQIFYELGSSMIHRLKFRSSWYFIGQKGIRVFSPFEDLNFASGNNWATPIDKALCVPLTLSGAAPVAQKSGATNAQKRHFCAKYDRLDDFCAESRLDDVIAPHPHSERMKANDAIFNVPILVVAGINMNKLRHSLESLISQEGINTQLVVVAHHKEYKIAGDLALLFHFKPLPINTTSSYNDLLLASLSAAFTLFPLTSSILILEEEVVLSPDFLSFNAQLLPILEKDPIIDMILAFNYNGFNRSSSSESTVYRVENQPPSYAYLMRRAFYTKAIHNALRSECCVSLRKWKLGTSTSLVAGMSRVLVNPSDVLSLASKEEKMLFRERRRAASETYVALTNVSTLTASEYGDWLTSKLNQSQLVPGNAWRATCQKAFNKSTTHFSSPSFKDVTALINTYNSTWLSLSYESNKERNDLLACFGLYNDGSFIPGQFGNLIRFAFEGKEMMLVYAN